MNESQIQRAVLRHLRQRGVSPILYFHVPNGGWRNISTASNLKNDGVLPGVSDLLLFHDKRAYGLELKTEKNSYPTAAQLDFKSRFDICAGDACIARGLDRAIAALESWGLLLK